jgi:hypothetical protein
MLFKVTSTSGLKDNHSLRLVFKSLQTFSSLGFKIITKNPRNKKRKPDKKSSLKRLEFIPRSLTKKMPFKNSFSDLSWRHGLFCSLAMPHQLIIISKLAFTHVSYLIFQVDPVSFRYIKFLSLFTIILILLCSWSFFFYVPYCIQHCFIYRPSDSTVSEDAGIEPRTVATSSLAVRLPNHSARSHPHSARSHPPLG